MFLCEGINIFLSFYVSFASMFLKTDGWSGTRRLMAELVA